MKYRVILAMSREDYERLISRFSCGKKFTCAAVHSGNVYSCALPKNHEGDCDDHPYRAVLMPDLGQDLLNRLNQTSQRWGNRGVFQSASGSR